MEDEFDIIEPREIVVDPERDWGLEWGQCPHCGGLFGVDVTYLSQIGDIVHCPMCCMEVQMSEPF